MIAELETFFGEIAPLRDGLQEAAKLPARPSLPHKERAEILAEIETLHRREHKTKAAAVKFVSEERGISERTIWSILKDAKQSSLD
jgi:hypothetical protein